MSHYVAATPSAPAHTRAAFRFSWKVPARRFFTADMCPISGNVQRTVEHTERTSKSHQIPTSRIEQIFHKKEAKFCNILFTLHRDTGQSWSGGCDYLSCANICPPAYKIRDTK